MRCQEQRAAAVAVVGGHQHSDNPVASRTGRAAPRLVRAAVAVDLSWLLPRAVAQHEVCSCRYRGTNRTTGNVV
jgi:hypothetical protein